MHVLFLTAHDGLGADVAVHLMLARTLDRQQIRVSAATGLPQVPGASACEAFGAIPELQHLRFDLGSTIGTQRGPARGLALLRNAKAAANLAQLAGWCRRNQVDVIHVTERPRQTLFGLFVAKLAGCACLVQAHISHYPHDATRLANLRLQLADAVVGVSHFTAQSYVRNAGLAPSRVFAVHNGVDASAFRPEVADQARAAMRRQLGLPLDAPAIGCVARLMRWKGQETLLEAFALVRRTVPQARLVLAGLSLDSAPDGRGDFRDFLIRRAEALGVADGLVLPGFVPQAEMPRFYGALDLVAHPAPEEPFGLAVVEAMASGRPVIASDRGGTTEIIRDQVDGLLVAVEEPPALAQAMRRVLADPALAQRLAAAGRRRVLETFTPDKQAAAMLQVYQQVIAQRHGALSRGFTRLRRQQSYG